MMEYVLGVDIGGSHITAGLVDMDGKSFVEGTQIRRRVDCHAAAGQIIADWAAAIEYSFSRSGTSELVNRDHWHIGMAMPGPFEYETGVSRIRGFNKYDELYGLNIKQLLGQKLGILPSHIKLKNDAACFLDGELFAGAASGGKEVLGITLGTGFGTAFGRGGTATDAELSQTAFKDRRAEDYFSTKWFIDTAYQEGGLVINGVMDLMNMSDHRDLAMKIFNQFSANLALFFEDYLSRYPQPDRVVIGGNIAQANHFFMDSLMSAFAKRGIALDIKISILGESAALIGAASLWQVKTIAE